jgi:hypothetical protein
VECAGGHAPRVVTSWPTPPDPPASETKAAELQRILFAGKVDAEVARRAWEASEQTRRDTDTLNRDAAAWAAEYALEKSVHDARIEVAKGAIDRSHAGAEFIRNAAAAIATVYTAVLGATYGAAGKIEQAPPRAIVPALFLGVSLVCAAAYVAFLTRGEKTGAPTAHDALRVYQENRVNTFVEWVALYAFRRAYALHAAVLSLAFGVAFLPVPFIEWSGWTVVAIPIVALAATLLVPLKTRPK